jgi:hypothetical protein
MINKTKWEELKSELLSMEYFEIHDYDELMECIDGDIVDHAYENNYQGDAWFMFKNNNMYGYLVFGWGSCSGCDELQGCSNVDDVEKLLISLDMSIIWKTKEEMLEYFKTKDWTLEFYYGNIDSYFNKFKDRVIAYLEKNHE